MTSLLEAQGLEVPTGFSYVGDGVYVSGSATTDMRLEYRYGDDLEAGGVEDEKIPYNLYDFDNYLQGTSRYNGVGSLVGTIYPESDVQWQMFAAGPTYPDLDDFNRVTSSRWTKDLSTDVDLYDLDIAYDRNSNPTRTEDNVHFSGWDVEYTIDDIDRVTSAEEGTWNGTSIPDDTRHQEWTLDHLGNWNLAKWDLNGDGDWSDTDEYQDDRTHNTVNELTGRDTDDNGTDDYTLSNDEVGNLTDDGENYTYEWDAFGRLRKVKNRSTSALVAEYRYNGLGHRIAEHVDTDDDGDVDASDKWYYFAYDEDWRWLATFREDDSDPKEEFVVQHAGLDGGGGSSYINGVVLRDKDANTARTDASDGTLENRVYYCQNWRGDVSALVTATGKMVEWVKYSAYGVPFGMPSGDADSDGDFDSADQTAIQGLIDTSSYEVRADQDLDGDVDTGDKIGSFMSLGMGKLSGSTNTHGLRGWHRATVVGEWYFASPHPDPYSAAFGRFGSRSSRSTYSMNSYSYSSEKSDAGPLETLGIDAPRCDPCDVPGGLAAWTVRTPQGRGGQQDEGLFVNVVILAAQYTTCPGHGQGIPVTCDPILFYEVIGSKKNLGIGIIENSDWQWDKSDGWFVGLYRAKFFRKNTDEFTAWDEHARTCNGPDEWCNKSLDSMEARARCWNPPPGDPAPHREETRPKVHTISWSCCGDQSRVIVGMFPPAAHMFQPAVVDC